jgi:hypothetical protein
VIHEDEDFSVDWNPIELSVLSPDAVTATSLVVSEVIPSAVSPDPQYYSPPFRSVDRTVALQVFLI